MTSIIIIFLGDSNRGSIQEDPRESTRAPKIHERNQKAESWKILCTWIWQIICWSQGLCVEWCTGTGTVFMHLSDSWSSVYSNIRLEWMSISMCHVTLNTIIYKLYYMSFISFLKPLLKSLFLWSWTATHIYKTFTSWLTLLLPFGTCLHRSAKKNYSMVGEKVSLLFFSFSCPNFHFLGKFSIFGGNKYQNPHFLGLNFAPLLFPLPPY